MIIAIIEKPSIHFRRNVHQTIHTDEKFNRNVLNVVCFFGFVRIVIEMFRNQSHWDSLDFYLDVIYGVVFMVTLIAIQKKASYQFIYYSFFIPLVGLLCLTLFDRRGLASGTENNIHIGLMIITLTMLSKDALKFSIYLIVGTLLALIAVEWKHRFFLDFSDYSTSSFNFIFMAIGAIFVTFYAKWIFEKSKRKLFLTQQKLIENRELLEASQAQLEHQTSELQALNQQLERKIDQRAALLKSQQAAMRKYLDVTLKELQDEYTDVQEIVSEAFQEPNDEISQMMLKSAEDLDLEITALVNKLKDQR